MRTGIEAANKPNKTAGLRKVIKKNNSFLFVKIQFGMAEFYATNYQLKD